MHLIQNRIPVGVVLTVFIIILYDTYDKDNNSMAF